MLSKSEKDFINSKKKFSFENGARFLERETYTSERITEKIYEYLLKQPEGKYYGITRKKNSVYITKDECICKGKIKNKINEMYEVLDVSKSCLNPYKLTSEETKKIIRILKDLLID